MDANDILVVEAMVFKTAYVATPFIKDGVLFTLGVFEMKTFTEGQGIASFTAMDDFLRAGKINPGDFSEV